MEIHEYRNREKEIILEENRSIMRELKRMDLILENFIPLSEIEQLKQKMIFSEEADAWIIARANE